MKFVWGLCLGLTLFIGFAAADNQVIRAQIGNTFSAPHLFNGKYYFIATTGVLYESNKDFTEINKLYEGKKSTIGSAFLQNGILYWGDGLHTDQKSTLHIFDLKTKKLLKDLEIEGHIERAPLIHAGLIYIPAGPEGMLAIDSQKFSIKWKTTTFETRKLHIDSNILPVGEKVCATSIQDFKGVICFAPKTGKVTQSSQLGRNPKSEITLWKDHVVGFATEGDFSKAKWDIPSDLFVYDVKNDKMKLSKELRGFNFFAPVIAGDEAFITLSTGDFLLINLNDGKVQFLGEFAEPFTNNPFMLDDQYCAIGIMGKYMCYTKTKLTIDKRLPETVIGNISVQNSKLIAPSAAGFYTEQK